MALKIVLTQAGSSGAPSEFSFGKEARARGISIGSDAGNDIVLPGVSARAGRVERQPDGYFYIDVGSSNGFKADGVDHPPGAKVKVTIGTVIWLGNYLLEFIRGEMPVPAPMPVRVVSTAEIEQAIEAAPSDIKSATHKHMSQISRYFLSEDKFSSVEEVERFAELVKMTLEISMEWMTRALKGREEFKAQFTAPVSQIFSAGANPVKKGQDISKIANFLLNWREERDVEEIHDALQHAFRDIARHQTGVLAGVQEFVSELQRRLNPAEIERAAGGGVFGGSKKAWERYLQVYSDTLSESSKLFNELIYPSIRKGYIFSHREDSTEGT